MLQRIAIGAHVEYAAGLSSLLEGEMKHPILATLLMISLMSAT